MQWEYSVQEIVPVPVARHFFIIGQCNGGRRASGTGCA